MLPSLDLENLSQFPASVRLPIHNYLRGVATRAAHGSVEDLQILVNMLVERETCPDNMLCLPVFYANLNQISREEEPWVAHEYLGDPLTKRHLPPGFSHRSWCRPMARHLASPTELGICSQLLFIVERLVHEPGSLSPFDEAVDAQEYARSHRGRGRKALRFGTAVFITTLFYIDGIYCVTDKISSAPLVSAGIAVPLVNDICAFHDSKIEYEIMADVLGVSLLNLYHYLQKCPPGWYRYVREGVTAGLLRGLVSYGIGGVEGAFKSAILAISVSLSTLYHFVVSRMEVASQDVDDLAKYPAFPKADMLQLWQDFRALLEKRRRS
ncbi:hypothetical protein C8R44DRAFT_742705 [Mycena epipterygia]|nr:hypothetical protein C8R44DRAFT_742705 [Mycena epipterygia]